MKITAWNIGIVWEDGTEENIGYVPDWVATRVDEFLNELECMGFIKNASETSIKEKKIEHLFRKFAEIIGSIYEKPIFNFGDKNFRAGLNNLFQQGLEIKEVRGSEYFIFFNRITFGLMSILMKLESNIETKGALEIIMNRESQE